MGMVDACKFAGEKVNHIAKVLGVYVRKAYRGQGKGRELMEALMNQLVSDQQIEKVRLSVNAAHPAAVKLYKDLGFEIVGTLHREMKIGGEYYDKYIMEKFL